MSSFQETIDKLNDLDLADLDFENVGMWPIAGKLAVWLLIAVVALGGGYWFLIQPTMNELARIENEEVEKRTRFERLARQASSIDIYRAQLVQIEESFSLLLSQLPTDTEVPGLIDDINDTGLSSGLRFNEIRLRPERSSEYYIELPIEIKVEGGFHDFGTFVSGVAGLSRIVTLHNFKIDGDRPSDLKMTIEARTYRYKGAGQ